MLAMCLSVTSLRVIGIKDAQVGERQAGPPTPTMEVTVPTASTSRSVSLRLHLSKALAGMTAWGICFSCQAMWYVAPLRRCLDDGRQTHRTPHAHCLNPDVGGEAVRLASLARRDEQPEMPTEFLETPKEFLRVRSSASLRAAVLAYEELPQQGPIRGR